jgi:hypothetical protein
MCFGYIDIYITQPMLHTYIFYGNKVIKVKQHLLLFYSSTFKVL